MSLILATAAETRLARVLEDESEDSNGSNFNDREKLDSSSSDEESGNASEGSDTEYAVSKVSQQSRHGGARGRKGPMPKKSVAAKQTTTQKTPSPTASTVSSASSVEAVTTTTSMTNSTSTATTVDSANTNGNSKELSDASLKCLIRNFRLTDLQALMIFVGKNKAGRKTELLVSVTVRHI